MATITATALVPPTAAQAATTNALSTLSGTPFAKSATALSQQLAQQMQKAAIQQKADPLVEELAVYGTVAQAVAGVMPGVTSGVLLAVNGFKSGDDLSGAAGLMDAIASLAPVVGAAIGAGIGSFVPVAGTSVGAVVGGVVGTILAGVFSMISDILSSFTPDTKSHAEKLSAELKAQLEAMKFQEVQVDIWTAHNQITIYALSLHDACDGIFSGKYNPRVMTEIIRGLNPIEGTTMHGYWGVISWLGVPGNEKKPHWPTILSAACNAYTSLLIAVMRLFAVVNSDAMADRYRKAKEKKKLGEEGSNKELAQQGEKEIAQLDELVDVANAKLIAFGWCNNLQLKALEQLRTAVRNRGTLWYFKENEGLHERVIDPLDNATDMDLGHAYKVMSVTAGTRDQSTTHPTYQVYGIRKDTSDLQHFPFIYDPGSSKYKKGDVQEFGDKPVDIYAIPGRDPRAGSNAFVYELMRNDAFGQVHYSIDATVRGPTGAKKKSFDVIGSAKLSQYHITTVRAVNDPYSYPEDRADGSLQDINHIVYGGCASGILASARDIGNSKNTLVSESYLKSPLKDLLKGIGVDQDYLWIFSATEFACATHAEVVRALKLTPGKEIKGEDIPWIISKVNQDWGWRELVSLYPCDDGTLVASAKDTQVYSAPYEIDLRRYTIKVGKWIPIKDCHAHSFEKLPVSCWPEFESLTETLKALEPVLSPKSLPRVPTEVWGIDDKKQVYRWNGQTGDKAHFEALKGATLTSIEVTDGDAWGLNSKDIYRWNGQSGPEAELVKVDGDNKGIESIVVVGREVWGIGNQNLVYPWNGTRWVNINTSLRNLAVSRGVPGKQGVWGLTVGQVQRWNGNDKFENMLHGGEVRHRGEVIQFDSIAVGDEEVWGITTPNQEIYKWNGKSGAEANFDKVNGRLKSIEVGDLGVWGIDNQDTACWWDGQAFKEVAGLKFTSIKVGDRGVWGISNQNTAYRWDGKEFKEAGGVKLKSIETGGLEVWGISNQDTVYRWDGEKFQKVATYLWDGQAFKEIAGVKFASIAVGR
ncbi:MAG: hypothetical protein JO319_13415 [Acidobacteriaceae bacterium]|nr:hypothetical protein [Acidobacteriaceae bacterium]